MRARGFQHLVNVHLGWNKIKNTDVPIETGAPSNLALS
jgi:hypothetical protein